MIAVIIFYLCKSEPRALITQKNCPNFELAHELLGFGEDIEVITQRHLHVKIGQRVENNWANYTKERVKIKLDSLHRINKLKCD